jgi:putative membrane protein
MKSIVLTTILLIAGLLVLNSCSDTAQNTNGNRNASAGSNLMSVNTAMNKAGNVVNTVANTISNAVGSATTSSPSTFLSDAVQGGMAEVEMGKLVATKSKDPEVKKFGQMMVTDHTAANAAAKAIAAKKNIEVPTDIGSHKSLVDKLSALTGADFDKAYVDGMVSDHEDDVATFEKQAANSTDADVRAFAAKTLPTLKKHLEAIKAIKAKMK